MKNTEEQITAYLLGELDAEETQAVERLLEEDERCRALAEELRPTLQLLRRALAAEAGPSPVLDQAHRQRVRDAATAGARRGARNPFNWVAVAAVLVAVAGLAMLFATPRPPAKQAAPAEQLYGVQIARNEELVTDPLPEVPDVTEPVLMAKLEAGGDASVAAPPPVDKSGELGPRTLASREAVARKVRDVRMDDALVRSRFGRAEVEKEPVVDTLRTASPAPASSIPVHSPPARGGARSVTLDELNVPAWPSDSLELEPCLRALRAACRSAGWAVVWEEPTTVPRATEPGETRGPTTLREALDDLDARFGVRHRVRGRELLLFVR